MTAARSAFALEQAAISLPAGATAQTMRHMLWHDQRALVGFTQGIFRHYLYPVYTPLGFPVTEESPADHPHHNSVWVGADHVHAVRPTASSVPDQATYGFYVNETFQGRAPGVIRQRHITGSTCPAGYEVKQQLEWRGPPEWGARDGDVVATERRQTTIRADATVNSIDIVSVLEPTRWALTIGPTRHAYFGVRLAESMAVANGGGMLASTGATDSAAISGSDASWVQCWGPVGGGNVAAVTASADLAGMAPHWFVTDWGVVSLNPFAEQPLRLPVGMSIRLRMQLLVQDGDDHPGDLATLDSAHPAHRAGRDVP